MKRDHLAARRTIAIAVATSVVGFLAATSPALASNTPEPTPTGSAILPGVIAQPDGWLLYTNTLVADLDLIGSKTTTLSGKKTADGRCVIKSNGPAGGTMAAATYEEEIAFNPKTCQERVTSGTLSPAGESQLAAADLSSRAAATDSDVPAQPSAVKARQTGKSSGGATALATSYGYANVKTSWVDPVNITITSLADNISWPLYGAGGTLNGQANPYKFAYDGWSESGVTFGPGDNGVFYNLAGDAGWGLRARDRFTNTDFASFVYVVFGPAGWASCGFPFTVTAHFNHDVTVYGYRNGARGWGWSDSKDGACTNLVHHRDSAGYGWTS